MDTYNCVKGNGLITVCLSVILLLCSTTAAADSCAVYFPDSVQGHSSSSTIKFKDSAKIINDSDSVLTFSNLNDESPGSNQTCGTTDCTIASTTAPPLTLPTFEKTTTSYDITTTWLTETIGIGGDYSVTEIDELKIGGTSDVTFLANSSKYLIDKGIFEGSGKITFNPGEYWFDELEIKGDARVYINGPVTIYVNTHFDIENSVEVNNDAGSAAKDLAIVGYEQIHLKGDVTVKAVLYGAGQDVHVHDSSKLIGAVSANGTVELKGTSTITYEDITGVAVGTICTSTPTVVDHFQIGHDSVGSTCAAESITIKACANSDCSTLVSGSVSLNFQADGVTKSAQTFVGTTTFTFNNSTAETLTLSVDSPSVTPANALVCSSGSGSSCDIVFDSTGCSAGGACTAVYPGAVNNNSNSGYIKFEKSGQIIDNPSSVLATTTVTHSGNSVATTCVSANCSASGTIVGTLLGSFITNSSNTNYEVNGTTQTIPTNDYKDIKVKSNGTLNMDSAYASYSFAKLKVESGGTVNMTPGDYYITDLEIKAATVNVIGSGTVRIWAKTKAKFKDSSIVNGGSAGDASKLFIYYYAEGDDKIKVESGATLAGFMYSLNKVEVKNSSGVYGGITAAAEIKIKDTATVTYKGSALSTINFGSACITTSADLDHYRYEYDGVALTCTAETVVVKACGNAACTSLFDNSSTVTFTATTPPSTTQSSTIQFTSSAGLSVAESTPGTLTLGMLNPNPSAPLICYENGVIDAACDYNLTDTGFKFLNETDGTEIIPTQLSGKPSDVGYNSATISLQALQINTNTGACASLFQDETKTSVELSFQCEDPGSCSTSAVEISNYDVSTSTMNTFVLSQYNTFSNHNLYFSSDSKATISIKYPDVGKIKLFARKSITLNGAPELVAGSSNSFVIRPFGIAMATEDNNPAATDNTGGAFARAGQSFNMNVYGAQWVDGEDDDNDGVPDSDANINDNPVTPNFGQETTPVSVTVTHALVSPIGGSASTLTNSAFSGFTDGIKTNAMNWNNVGIISLAAVLDTGTYLGTDTIVGTVPHLGRFIPNHFRLNSSSIDNACVNFSYMGQPFDLSIDLEAQGVGDIPLNNYSANLGAGADNHALATYTFVAENSDDGNDLGGRLSAMTTPWSAGSVVQAYTPNFSRNSVATVIDGPFDNTFVAINLDDGEVGTTIDLVDVDGGGYNLKASEAGDCSVALNCDALKLRAPGNIITKEVSFRYGRLTSAQVFGPASRSLTLPMYTQAWNGSSFVLSTDDGCSTIDAANVSLSGVQNTPFDDDYNLLSLSTHADIGDVQVDLSPANTTDSTLTALDGAFNLTLGQSTVINGYVPVIIKDLDAWLRFNWDGGVDGVADIDLPSQNATFGQFRGNDRVIYWREKR